MDHPMRGAAMGHVILPSGTTVWVEELSGSVNLSQLVNDMKCDDYTASYRISIIAALGKLGKHAESAISYLKDLSSKTGGVVTANDKLLADAAEQAIKKIESGEATTHKSETYGPAHVDNRYNRGGHFGNGHNNVNYAGSCATGGGVSSGKKLEVHKVTFTEIEDGPLHEGLKVYCRCNFCEKMTVANRYYKKFSDRLAGADKFYCHFCVRNDYYQRFNNNVMVLTYRGLFGYYYYSYYVAPKSPSMYIIDIQDYLELHIKAGLQNPVFRYDPETFCWFIDFSKVGKSKRKMPVESVLHTIIEQLACFNLYENVRESSPAKLYQKYQAAVMDFYQHRARTNGDKVFAPTLVGCDIPTRCPAGTRGIPVDVLQNFLPMNMVDNNQRNNRVRY